MIPPIQSVPNPYEKSYLTFQPTAKKVAVAILLGSVSIGFTLSVVAVITKSVIPIAVAGLAFLVASRVFKAVFFFIPINENECLHQAAEKGQVMMTRLLLILGADPTATSKQGNTPLHMACFKADQPNSKAHIKVMELLVNAGANVNAPGFDHQCPLHYAIEARHVDRVEFLVDHGAYINFKSACNPDWSPWEYAKYAYEKKTIGGKFHGDPRSDQELLDADKRIYEILSTKGKEFVPNS